MGKRSITPGLPKEQARKIFDSKRKSCLLSFDQILELIDKGLTDQAIADQAGISKARAQLIRGKLRAYTAHPELTGQQRRQALDQTERRRLQEKLQQQTQGHDPAAFAARLAQRHGLPFARMFHPNLTLKQYRVEINLWKCHALVSSHTRMTSQRTDRKYWYFNLTKACRKESEFVVLFCLDDGVKVVTYYIIPTEQLPDVFTLDIADQRIHKKSATLGRRPAHDLSPYRENLAPLRRAKPRSQS